MYDINPRTLWETLGAVQWCCFSKRVRTFWKHTDWCHSEHCKTPPHCQIRHVATQLWLAYGAAVRVLCDWLKTPTWRKMTASRTGCRTKTEPKTRKTLFFSTRTEPERSDFFHCGAKPKRKNNAFRFRLASFSGAFHACTGCTCGSTMLPLL